MRYEHASAIPGALVDRRDLNLFVVVLEVVERELERRGHRVAANLEPPGRRRDLGNVCQVPPDIERVVRGEHFVEIGDWRLIVRRPPGLLDQGDLAGKRLED